MFDFWNNEADLCFCNHCDKENDCENGFCIFCGKKLPTAQEREEKKKRARKIRRCKCEKCKYLNDCNDEFCVKCGHALKGSLSDEELYDHVTMSLDGIIVSLLAKTAKVGGKIGKNEATFITNVFTIFAKKRSQSVQIVPIYAKIFDDEKNNLSNIDTQCNKLGSMSVMRDLKIEIIRLFVELAFLDQNYNKRQEDIILKIVKKLKVEEMFYQNIRNEFDPNDSNKNTNADALTIEQCYEILECDKNTSADIIKTNYRKLVRQYHYDNIVSKDLPKDMLLFAEEKLKRINAAYNLLKQ